MLGCAKNAVWLAPGIYHLCFIIYHSTFTGLLSGIFKECRKAKTDR